VLSAAGLLCTKIRSRLSDEILDTCAFFLTAAANPLPIADTIKAIKVQLAVAKRLSAVAYL